LNGIYFRGECNGRVAVENKEQIKRNPIILTGFLRISCFRYNSCRTSRSWCTNLLLLFSVWETSCFL